MTKSGRVLSGKHVVISIPIDFWIKFWNSIFSPVLEYTVGIFLTASARAFRRCKPGCVAASVLKLFKFFLGPSYLFRLLDLNRGFEPRITGFSHQCSDQKGQNLIIVMIKPFQSTNYGSSPEEEVFPIDTKKVL